MAHLHFDCFSGMSGDMTLGALVDTGLPLKDLAQALKALPARGYRLRGKAVTRGGLRATKVDVLIERGYEAALSLTDIRRLIGSSRLPVPVKDRSQAVFDRLAAAEGLAHRVKPDEVRFHEVGVIDSLVDVIGAVLACHLLGVTRVSASAINVGSGFIDTSHGRLPVPGPAVAALARGLPIYSAGPARELTTPTGLALLATLTNEFGALPLMKPTRVGYGAGEAAPDGWPNVLRVFLDESPPAPGETDTITQIETNLDDLNPQAYDVVMERLFAAGAVDVALTPCTMKHGRPGIVLTALASPPKAPAVADVLLRETTTLGVRVQEVTRRILPRRLESVSLRGARVRIKVAELGDGQIKAAPEYQDCKRLADQTGLPVRQILEDAMVMWRRGQILPGSTTRSTRRPRRR